MPPFAEAHGWAVAPENMKLETPKTSAAAKRALEQLQACGSADDYKSAVKSLVSDLLGTAKELETENRLLRNGCSQIAASLGNGSAASPDASVGFLTDGLANEVKLYCEWLRSKAGDVTARPNDELSDGPSKT